MWQPRPARRRPGSSPRRRPAGPLCATRSRRPSRAYSTRPTRRRANAASARTPDGRSRSRRPGGGTRTITQSILRSTCSSWQPTAASGRMATIAQAGVVHTGGGDMATTDFDAYVAQAWPRLLRSAWLLTGDWHRAEDLVQTVLARAYGRWHRLRNDAPDAYLRAMLATTYLSWRRRKWRGEIPVERLPESPGRDLHHEIELRHMMRVALARLPRRQRAVLMLRFHGDFTEVATAEALGLSVGTVKSYTARALASLRADPRLRAIVTEEVAREPRR